MSSEQTEYLNKERKEAWKRIEAIEASFSGLKSSIEEATKLAESKISLDEAAAKKALIDASANAKNAQAKSEEAIALLDEVRKVVDSYKNNKPLLNNAIKKTEELNEKYTSIVETETAIAASQTKIQALQTQVTASLAAAQQSENQIKTTETNATNTSTKIADLLSKSTKLKGDISDLYDEVMGYDYTDEKTGTQVHEDGLKEELEKTYKTLSTSIVDQEKATKQFLGSTREELDKLKSSYDTTFEEKKKRIEELLPGALTTGLSEAYAAKKKEEEKRLASYKSSFNWSIVGLVIVSVIPLIANAILYFKYKYELTQIFTLLPTSLSFVIPLYLPIFWLAWNANKEMKLSKRLIEEYSHKEVLSRTYQGLALQVKELGDEDISIQLRNRLLYNMISTSSENPGKLITDYNKCDNPLLEVLDRSIALADTFEKVKDIPGFGKLSRYLNKKEQKNLKEVESKSQKGIAVQEELESNE